MIPFLLAPMAELTHRALRELIEDFKMPPDEYFTEMISAGALITGGPFEAWYLDGGPRPEKLVYQLLGADEDRLALAAALLDQKECLGIDINMGCSAPIITRTGAGVRWMADIDRAAALIRRLRRQTSRRLSVKLRIGLSDDFEYLVRFCRRLEEEGLDRITLHPRTAREKFKRRARWEYIFALRKELRIPLAGNGDISSAEEMLARSEECDAVMIGRLAVRRPWVFAEANRIRDQEGNLRPLGSVGDRGLRTGDQGIEAGEQGLEIDLEGIGLRFLELLARYQPAEFHLSRARRFFSYFCDNLKWAHHVKTLLNRETDLAGIERVWRRYFVEL